MITLTIGTIILTGPSKLAFALAGMNILASAVNLAAAIICKA